MESPLSNNIRNIISNPINGQKLTEAVINGPNSKGEINVEINGKIITLLEVGKEYSQK